VKNIKERWKAVSLGRKTVLDRFGDMVGRYVLGSGKIGDRPGDFYYPEI